MNTGADTNLERLLVQIDCTQAETGERYFEHGAVRVVEGPAGRYREAEGVPLSRFGYRFAVQHPGAPHVAVIRYPDDRRRFMTIMDGTGYDLSTGILTGGAQPLSGGMLELRQVFWPRWHDCSIVFTTWSTGEPAAVAAVAIHELPDLPPLSVPGDPGDPGNGARRQLGVQYEDPCGTGASEGALDRAAWTARVATYLRHTGQSLLVYPLVWYHGPQIPSAREPADAFDVVVGRDRRQYVRWTTRPPEWVVPLLERFGREGLQFRGALTLLRLGSLMARMQTSLAAAQAGADTINNLLWCDQVQAGTMDWTVLYNSRNYPRMLEYHAAERDQSDFPWAYGEQAGQPYPGGPIFNPLHPQVQAAVLALVEEIAGRYAPYPAFSGLSLNLWHATIGWFGSLRSGYDDRTVAAFSRETGIQVPVPADAPDRFSRRHHFLTSVCRPAWIDWRCRRVRDLVLALRDRVRAARPDLTLTLTLWDETTVPQLLGFASAATQLGARPGLAELCREGGVDLRLFRDEPGLEVDLGMGNTRDRGGHPPDSTSGIEAALESTTMYRDHDFLDSRTLDEVAAQRRPGAFVFNCWVEAWGRHRWFPCAADDAQAVALAAMGDQPAEGIFRINSEYPPDGFWWDSQLRITPAFPAGSHFMEPYAHALAELDALRITRGGLFLDKAHGEELRRFAVAYRALPDRRFQTVGVSTDPVAVRQLVADGRLYVYLVNRDYYPVTVRLCWGAAPVDWLDLATGVPQDPATAQGLVLGPYELRAFAASAAARLEGFRAQPPAEVAAAVLAAATEAVRALAAAAAAGQFVPGAEDLASRIADAMEAGRLAWLRRALCSYAVRRARALQESAGEEASAKASAEAWAEAAAEA